MRLTAPPFEIADDEGFAPEKDIFNRKIQGERLTALISQVTDPLVVAVDAQWGAGKTSFLKMWAGELRKNGHPVIYFDAFESDYVNDAFTALAGEIVGLSERLKKHNSPKMKAFRQKAIAAGKLVLRGSAKIGVKAITMNSIHLEEIEDIVKDAADEAGDIADKLVGELIFQREKEKNSILDFKSALENLPELLSPKIPDSDKNEPSKSLVFIIDELDRCRPLFALEILERIKHFFNVNNVHFILGVHSKQLENSIKIAYGDNIDANTYLQKFIQITYELTDNAEYHNDKITTKYITWLFSSLGFPPNKQNIVNQHMNTLIYCANVQELSLRTIERISSLIVLSVISAGDNFWTDPNIVTELCVLKIVYPDLYRRSKIGTITYGEIDSIFKFSKATPESNYDVTSDVMLWQYTSLEEVPESLVKNVEPYMPIGLRSGRKILPYLCKNIIEKFSLS